MARVLSETDRRLLQELISWWRLNKNTRPSYRRRNLASSSSHNHLKDFLLAWYPFNGNANDLSGNERDGTLQGDANVNLDILELDGTGDYITTGSDFIGIGPVCVTFWMRSTSAFGTIISNGKFIIKVLALIGRISVYSNGTTATNSSMNVFDDTDLVHVAINRYADGTVDIYINGIADVTGGVGSTPVAGTTNVTIGATAAGATALRGALDDFRIYRGTRSGDEINQIYEQGHTRRFIHAKQVFGAAKLFAVVSAGTGDGIYNCYEQKLDATDWPGTDGVSKIVGKNTTSIEVQNLAEFDTEPEYVAQLAAGDLLLAFLYGDDESNRRWVGVPFRKTAEGAALRNAYCKTNADAGSTIVCYLDTDGTGTEITVNCDISNGTDLNAATRRLKDGNRLAVYKIGATWYCAEGFQKSKNCVCTPP